MISTITKRRFIITKIRISKIERFKTFEIKLPANVKRLTGILVTATGTISSQERLGTITFQANDRSDVFHISEVREDGLELSDETMVGVEDPEFDSVMTWITGNVPKFRSVHVDGDSSIITAWFKGEYFERPYSITIYLEYEEAEQLVPDGIANDEPEQPKEV